MSIEDSSNLFIEALKQVKTSDYTEIALDAFNRELRTLTTLKFNLTVGTVDKLMKINDRYGAIVTSGVFITIVGMSQHITFEDEILEFMDKIWHFGR